MLTHHSTLIMGTRTTEPSSGHSTEESPLSLSQPQQPQSNDQLLSNNAVLASFVQDLSFWDLSTIPEEQQQLVSSTKAEGKNASQKSRLFDGNKKKQRNKRRALVEEEKKTEKGFDDGTCSSEPALLKRDEIKNGHDPGSAVGSASSTCTTKTSSASTTRPVWRTAVDPVTGRTYYYDSVTRQTQWEKPDEIRTLERKARKEKRRRDQMFFEEVKRNILASLERGELIPGIPQSQESCVLMTHERNPSLAQSPDGDDSIGFPLQEGSQCQRPAPMRVRTISGMNEQLLAELKTNPPGVKAGSSYSHTTRHVSGGLSSSEGRPPLPQRGPPGRSLSPMDSMELSPDSRARSVVSTEGEYQVETDSLRGVDLVDGPILGNDPLSSSAGAMEATTGNPTVETFPDAQLQVSKPQSLSRLPHVRRNTGGTIYVQSTMENPDVNATIKCVCGVYRAHIVQSSSARGGQQSPASVVENMSLDIFRDDYESQFQPTKRRKPLPVPSLADIELFYHDFYRRSQMEHDTIIMSLIYVERLIKETNGALTPSPSNWKSVLFSCMVLSSKVWDDLSMFNLDFSNVSMASGLSSFSLQRTNALELAVLQALNFDVKVPASEYAKYYFLIRTMLLRSGLVDAGADAHVPLRKEHDGKTLEMKTLRYQDSKLGGQPQRRRARSMDWRFLGQETEPVLKDTLCLEQIVCMDR